METEKPVIVNFRDRFVRGIALVETEKEKKAMRIGLVRYTTTIIDVRIGGNVESIEVGDVYLDDVKNWEIAQKINTLLDRLDKMDKEKESLESESDIFSEQVETLGSEMIPLKWKEEMVKEL